jgi:hypothetical protein
VSPTVDYSILQEKIKKIEKKKKENNHGLAELSNLQDTDTADRRPRLWRAPDFTG